MRRGLVRTSPKHHSVWLWPAALILIAASGAFTWDVYAGSGTTHDARRAAFQGNEVEQRQAIVALFEDACRSIETLQARATCGNPEIEAQAKIALEHLRARLR